MDQPVLASLNALISGNLYAMMIVFSRTGTALMLMPGLANNYTPARLRLFLALGVSLLIAPIVRPLLPPEPADAMTLFAMIAEEAAIGIFLGTIATLFMGALETAGQIIAQQLGLSNAYIFNPQAETQGSIPGTLLSMAAVVTLFATDMYQMLLKAIVDSYRVFRYGDLIQLGDMSDIVAHLVGRTFQLGVEIASPFLVVGLLLYTVFGLIGKLLPQIQVFFVTLPLQIGLGLLLFAMVAPFIIRMWTASFVAALSSLGIGG